MAENYANNYSTTLNGAINSAATSLTLASATGAPNAPFRLLIDSELMLVGARSGTACSSITRGVEGTTAASHSNGAIIYHPLTAATINYLPLLTTLSLTDAQIKALPTAAPLLFIPAPGAGKRTLVKFGQWRATTSSGAYANLHATAKLRLVYGNNIIEASYPVGPTPLAALLGTAGVKSVPMHYWEEGASDVTIVENVAINISIDNFGNGDLTGGHASNILKVSAWHVTIDA